MAVNVDIVYKTVLLILNQQQRGYITPDEFNKVATQVQLTIFEAYASNLNQQYRKPQNDTEYANHIKNLEEKLQFFQTSGTANYVGPHFTLPTTSIVPTVVETFVGNPPIDGVNTIFNVTLWTTAQSNGAQIVVLLDGVVQAAGIDYTWNAGANQLTMVVAPPLLSNLVVQLFPSDFYRLGTVLYKNFKIAQYVQRNELAQLLLSPLTQPTEDFPLYNYENDLLYMHPPTIQGDVTITYLKKPANVVWNYTIGGVGEFLYSATSSTNFELDVTEQNDIILRILAYSGVIIQDPSIIQVASQAVAAEETNEKS
jgi:hypothetical protein|tara:strand:- start:20253 stop:21188 length:936 start_codon:yes stop_codon:yes gene_type:complete